MLVLIQKYLFSIFVFHFTNHHMFSRTAKKWCPFEYAELNSVPLVYIYELTETNIIS